MSRFRRAIHNVASGYMGLGANVVFALASIPLALHYLSKERFALWALMASISGYLNLIDLGMSGSVARLLIDHKDEPARGTYGSMVQTGWLVFAVQAALLFLTCFALAPCLADLLGINTGLRPEFIALLRWQGAQLGLGFALRIFNHVLFAHQRLDVLNYGQGGALGLNLLLQLCFFHAGQGVLSLVWAGLLSSLVTSLALSLACWRLRLLPPAHCWGHPDWRLFRELFSYGKDLFLVALGTQLILASQTLIITRRLGLVQAAIWAVGTKGFNLVSQLVWRVYDSAGPGLVEMLVRGEQTRLLERYRTIVTVSVSFATLCAGVYAMCNSLFVGPWTAGKITWPPLNDILLGAWLIVTAFVHCHNGFIITTKEVRFMRYIYFLEGSLFVLAALAVARLGLGAIILCSVLCSIAFSGSYGIWRVARFFALPVKEVAWEWSRPAWAFLWRFAPVGILTWYLSTPLTGLSRVALHAIVAALVGGGLFARYGLPAAFQGELLERLPGPAAKLVAPFFAGLSKRKRFVPGPV